MAVPQASSSNGKNQPSSSARFRQRKISVKQPLAIYRLKDLPANDVINELEPSQVHHLNNSQQQRDLHSIETGVDKNEEDEVHLQQVINAAQKALLSSQKDDSKNDKSDKDQDNESKTSVYIPTPDASKIWPEAHRFYNDQQFVEPEGYIKFSAQVEDTIGVDYNIDEVDEEFLTKVLNKDHNKKEPPCSELEFEIVASKLEQIIEEKQPFLSMDPSNILSYKELSNYILEEFKSSHKNHPYLQIGSNLKYISSSTLKERLGKDLNFEPFVTIFDKNPLDQGKGNSPRPVNKLLELFGEQIYSHWRERKIERNGKSITPSLKFEDPNANEKDNDNDPYICFRRREFRQARKTRRADTMGIEKIRLLQKSLHRARDIIFNVSQREVLKLENFKLEANIFKLRCQAKNVKREIGIVGDDHLFYPHKRRKVIKPKEEEEEQQREKDSKESKLKREKKYKDQKNDLVNNNINKYDKNQHYQSQIQAQESQSASSQPYVKLAPSKIPDLNLITVSLVLKEKNETIRRAVLEKIRKRKEMDKNFVNLTDDPYQPFFNLSTNNSLPVKELRHIPYSSIASANLHQMNSSNYLNESLKKLLEEGKAPLPGMRTFNGETGELVPSKPFPHLQTLLNDHLKSKRSSNGYIAHLLSNIENNNFSVYSNGFGNQVQELEQDEYKSVNRISDPIYRLRRRVGRLNRTFVDRRDLKSDKDVVNDFLTFDDEDHNNSEVGEVDSGVDEMDVDSGNSAAPYDMFNVYNNRSDAFNRLTSRWKFDDEAAEYDIDCDNPFSLDPSRLNSISDETQSIRFGSMLLSKSYELLRESVHQRQQAYIQQARMRALQQQQQQYRNARNLQRIPQGSPNPSSTSSSSKLNPTQTTSSSGGSNSSSTGVNSKARIASSAAGNNRSSSSDLNAPKNNPQVANRMASTSPQNKLKNSN